MKVEIKKCSKFVNLLLVICFLFSATSFVWAESLGSKKNVLILHSYHKGNKWTDNIMEGIASVLETHSSNINMYYEYMDSKRISDPEYKTKLHEIYKYKFQNKKFDVIICSDDNAFDFLLNHNQELFPDTPIVFCGVNYFEDSMLANQPLFTGVVETQDAAATLDVMLKLHPNTKNIYVIYDRTITGLAVEKAFQSVMPQFADKVNFISLSHLNMGEILPKLQRLNDDSLVLYFFFYEDAEGNNFNYNESAAMVSANSPVPVYSGWDYNLGHGIVGGMLVSGYYQGEAAAKMAWRIINGERPADIPVLKQSPNRYMFDDVQLKHFGIDKLKLPEDSLIINETYSDKKQILVLHSYHHGLSWTDSIGKGLASVFDKNIDIYYEYMDTKRNTGPEYIQKLYDIYKDKFGKKKFDAIIVNDDPAYKFMLNYHDDLFPGVPVVFCGVNYFEEDSMVQKQYFTGLVESVDIKGTIDLALRLHPYSKEVYVINDKTQTGAAIKKQMEEFIPNYPSTMKFIFLEDYNMFELQEKVAGLPQDSIILMLVFNKDKSNNIFTYEQSMDLIAQKAKVPIYSVWDFYLEHGIVGGHLTNGFSQGESAAHMTMQILSGKKPSEIPVVMNGPVQYMFDYNQLTKFGIDMSRLPSDSIVINKPTPFLEKYLSTIALTLLGVLTGVLIIQRKKAQDELKYYATTDTMTGVFNRRTGLLFLEKQVELSRRNGEKLTICFIDVDGLKQVNDTYGHAEGDELIKMVSQVLKQSIRSSDVLCRIGGDEFLVILPNCDSEQAAILWQRIQDSINIMNAQGHKSYNISISHGFAEYNCENPVSLEELVKVADDRMYKEKIQTKELCVFKS